MEKQSWIRTCSDWVDHFSNMLDCKKRDYDDAHLVVSNYDISCLKNTSKERCPGGKPAQSYHAVDNITPEKYQYSSFFPLLAYKMSCLYMMQRNSLDGVKSTTYLNYIAL